MDGLDKVLCILTNDKVKINSEVVETFAIDDSPSIHLTEQDRYNLWMLILYYYATDKKLPDSVCNSWMNSFVKDGTPNRNRILFMIDWAPALSESPLDRPRQIGVISILLSMLQHFTCKACADTRRRPLLIGVWRTLCSLLTFTPCYKRASTLILIRRGDEIKGLRPEIQEIIIELEVKLKNSATPILSRIRPQGRWNLPFTHRTATCYRLAKTVYDETKDLCLVARILYIPIYRVCRDTDINLEMSPDDQTREQKIVQVDRVRQGYLTVLGFDSLLPVNHDQLKNMPLATYSWMSLILLTKISMCLYPTTSPVREGLANQIEMIFNAGMESINSEDENTVCT
ncbi:hypothetical protein K501DRAFT_280764 [Backusella circina FSU 941]|nr:hypothetical protein K501DRAFT_280764 [Backusella circina FSU 941]